MLRSRALLLSLLLSLTACAVTAEDHRAAVSNTDKDRISVGKVQHEIKVGMASSDVVEVLGSPNMVTTDDQRRESWIYDKVATEKVYSTSSGGLGLIFGGIGGPVGGAAGGSFGSSSGAASTTQRTLTIIIKFDAQGRVRDYAYHSSSF
ncbi:MAG: hypothetical protein PHW76_06345 [Alphaproteobacteria bacterium]|nr:hypothetical protein [Alphaproteobacteria bacterium]